MIDIELFILIIIPDLLSFTKSLVKILRRNMMLKKISYVVVILAIILSFTACSGNTQKTNAGIDTAATSATTAETSASTEVPSPSPTPSAQSGSAGDFVLPAAGVRPVAVMIDNEGTRSLPQGGLYKAQVVYEIIVEGGETRLMPVFWGTDPEMIGPVRSSRHYFLDYVLENDAIYVHYGWSPMAQKDIPKLKINNINGVANSGGIFYDLTKDKYNWQDSYTSMKKILDYSKKVKYRLETDKKPIFTYSASDVPFADGASAVKVSLRFSQSYTCAFEYDQASGLYNRFRKGKPHMERNTGNQLTAKNILIQVTPSSSIKGDDKGRQEVSTVGKGSGYLISDGKSVKIKWSKASRSDATIYTYEDGTAISLNPGQTWVEILPTYGKVVIE